MRNVTVSLALVGLWVVKPVALFGEDALSLDAVLERHDRGMAKLNAGTGVMEVELYHEAPNARFEDFIHVPHAQTVPADVHTFAEFEKQGFNPAKGHFRARYRWWFKADKVRSDRSPMPLPEGAFALGTVGHARSSRDGVREIHAMGPSRKAGDQNPESITLVLLQPPGLNAYLADPYHDLFTRPCAVDVRKLMMPAARDLSGRIRRCTEKLGMDAALEVVDGKIRLELSDAQRVNRYVFDPARDYHVVQAEHLFLGRQSLVFDARHRKIGDVWFLDSFTAKDVEVRPDDDPATTKDSWTEIKVKFSEVQLPGAPTIPDELFTLEGMGVPAGTRITDMTATPKPREYRYKQDTSQAE